MGQIVFNNQKLKYCKLQAIRPGGHHINDDVALNEVWLVDTTNSQKSETGTGEYDAYIIGDGVKKAGQLPLHYNTPRSLSELEGDSLHRTVTDEDITRWDTDGLQIVNITRANTFLSAEIGKYYNITPEVNTLAITLPTVTSIASVKVVSLNLTTGSEPNITFTSDTPISYFDNYQINGNNNYEISCLYNGSKWIIANASLS